MRITRRVKPDREDLGRAASRNRNLTIAVLAATGLVAADRGGTSDPFATILFPTLDRPIKTQVCGRLRLCVCRIKVCVDRWDTSYLYVIRSFPILM